MKNDQITELRGNLLAEQFIGPSSLASSLCIGCDQFLPVNDLGLCDTCFAKFEHDLIRSRDWDYSITAFAVEPDQLEVLRQRTINDYGEAYELIEAADIPGKRKNKRSHSKTRQRTDELTEKAVRTYSIDDVLHAARDFIQKQDELWVNCSLIAQHLYEHFYKLNPKHLGAPEKKYKSLLKFIQDYPTDFVVRQDEVNRGVYWIQIKSS